LFLVILISIVIIILYQMIYYNNYIVIPVLTFFHSIPWLLAYQVCRRDSDGCVDALIRQRVSATVSGRAKEDGRPGAS
jgi:hypothetical protein